uniref:Nucleoporin Nup37 n=1 Tax=Pygocentrus nattereri TaxID=42514 RepID=A0AAR2KHT6_PYGNA
MQEDASRSATYTMPCEDYVHVVEFSPYDCGSAASLLAYGGNQYVVVGTCRFKEENTDIEGVEFNTLRVFVHGVRVDALAWSPESRLDKLPQIIRFCTAAADRKLKLFTSDLQNRHEVKVMEGHTSYINHVVFEPTEGKQIASVSDDHTCRVWDLDGNETVSFRLWSPGVSVCWHPEEVFKLMVAEKKGTIRFYDLVSQQAILSLDSGQMPLMSADWCLTNTIKVGAVVGSDWVIWDITRSRLFSPHLVLGVLEALGHKVHGLECLILVGLDRRLNRVEWFVFRFIGESVLEQRTRHGYMNLKPAQSLQRRGQDSKLSCYPVLQCSGPP